MQQTVHIVFLVKIHQCLFLLDKQDGKKGARIQVTEVRGWGLRGGVEGELDYHDWSHISINFGWLPDRLDDREGQFDWLTFQGLVDRQLRLTIIWICSWKCLVDLLIKDKVDFSWIDRYGLGR